MWVSVTLIRNISIKMKNSNLANQRDPKVRLEAPGFSWGIQEHLEERSHWEEASDLEKRESFKVISPLVLGSWILEGKET